jgi:hypothetical protein
VRQVGYLPELFKDARSGKYKIIVYCQPAIRHSEPDTVEKQSSKNSSNILQYSTIIDSGNSVELS